MLTTTSRHVLRAKLARAVQLDASAERIAGLRAEYHAATARDFLSELLAADRLLPEHRAQLAELLVGGDRDVAA